MKRTRKKPPKQLPGTCERCKQCKKKCVYSDGSSVCKDCKSSNLGHACVPAGPGCSSNIFPVKPKPTHPLRMAAQVKLPAIPEANSEDCEINFRTLGIYIPNSIHKLLTCSTDTVDIQSAGASGESEIDDDHFAAEVNEEDEDQTSDDSLSPPYKKQVVPATNSKRQQTTQPVESWSRRMTLEPVSKGDSELEYDLETCCKPTLSHLVTISHTKLFFSLLYQCGCCPCRWHQVTLSSSLWSDLRGSSTQSC